MAEQNVITSMLDDLSKEQPIHTALCIGQEIDQNASIQWNYFSVTDFLNLPFTQRYDLGFVLFDTEEMQTISDSQKSQILTELITNTLNLRCKFFNNQIALFN